MRRPNRKRRVYLPPRFVNFKPSGVPRRRLEKVELTLENLKEQFGYTEETAREAIGFLVRHRYAEGD